MIPYSQIEYTMQIALFRNLTILQKEAEIHQLLSFYIFKSTLSAKNLAKRSFTF